MYAAFPDMLVAPADELTLRQADIYDVATVFSMLNKTRAWVHDQGHTRQWRPDFEWQDVESAAINRELRVATLAGKTIGSYMLQHTDAVWSDLPNPDALYLHRLAVDPASHGKNLGGILLADALLTADEQDRAAVRLHCQNKEKLLGFYRRNGFNQVEPSPVQPEVVRFEQATYEFDRGQQLPLSVIRMAA